MHRGDIPRVLGLLLIVIVATTTKAARAQNNQFTERSFVPSPVVLGMGDAGVALSGWEQAFFYNPAHLPRTPSHFSVFGLQGATTRSLDDHIHFLNQDVPPAISKKNDLSTEALAELEREASALGRQPSRGFGSVLLPSFVYSPGALAVGGGLFTKTAVNYRIEHGSAGVPSAWLLSRTDLMALLSVGLDLRVIGLNGLSVGVTGTQTRRFLAFKNKPLLQFEQDEQAVLLEGGTFQLDAGLTYRLPGLGSLPGTVRLGAALYDFLDEGYEYTTGGAARLPFLNEIVDEPDVNGGGPAFQEVQRAYDLFVLRPSYRVGAAYQLSSLFFLEDVGLAVDYQGYGEGEQGKLARIHAGIRAGLFGPVHVRGGVSSGYPSGGLGLDFGSVHVDYSLHGMEEGRRAGQLHSYVHTARVLVRLE